MDLFIKPRLCIRIRYENLKFNKNKGSRTFFDEGICYISISKKGVSVYF